MSDPLIGRLAELPMAVLDPARAERRRQRCRARLSQSEGRAASVPRTARRGVIVMLWPPVVAGLGVAYLTAVILVALAVYGGR